MAGIVLDVVQKLSEKNGHIEALVASMRAAEEEIGKTQQEMRAIVAESVLGDVEKAAVRQLYHLDAAGPTTEVPEPAVVVAKRTVKSVVVDSPPKGRPGRKPSGMGVSDTDFRNMYQSKGADAAARFAEMSLRAAQRRMARINGGMAA
jgi:hypothetical protein